MLNAGEASPDGLVTARGSVRDVVYLGAITRYVVELDEGAELVVVRQNLDVTAEQAQAEKGRQVVLAWRPEHMSKVQEEEQR
jgi:putative spermidine/putrescine transport system ATP-binding protein